MFKIIAPFCPWFVEVLETAVGRATLECETLILKCSWGIKNDRAEKKSRQVNLSNSIEQVVMDLNLVLKECVNKFPTSLCGAHRTSEPETFVLNTPSTSPADQVRVVVTLLGDHISHGDINLKLPRQIGSVVAGSGAAGKDLYQNTTIREDSPWCVINRNSSLLNPSLIFMN